MYTPGSAILSGLPAPPARCTLPDLHSAGGTSAPNRASSGRHCYPFCADGPVLQQNTQAKRQRTACANILTGIFFPPRLFKWLSFRQTMPAAGCYKFPTGDAEPAVQAAAQTLPGICYRDRLHIKSCYLLGAAKGLQRSRERTMLAPFTSSVILAILSKSGWTNKVTEKTWFNFFFFFFSESRMEQFFQQRGTLEHS